MQNRGVSEFIGLVLMILIVVVLFVIVFFAFDVRKYFTEGSPCSDVKVDVVGACYNEKNIIIKIKNNGDLDVNNGFLFKIYGNEEYDVPSMPFTLLSGFGVKEIVLPYEGFIKKVDKIIVLPKIIVNEKQYICDSNLEGYKLNAC